MILYHGGYEEVREPRVIQSEIGRDFGFAFYTTDIRPQAERWAIRKARIESRHRRRAVTPILNLYEWDDAAAEELSIKRFDDPDLDWLDLVVRCRGNVAYRHNYDIVIGKIANDNVGETVSYVMQGIMRREDAVQRLRFEKINNQIAFCTNAAIRTLRFLESHPLEAMT